MENGEGTAESTEETQTGETQSGPCPACSGNGYTDDSCPDCDGAGCEECGDSGEVELPCDACDSTGVVVVNEGDVK